MEALQAVNLSLVASYGVPLVLAPRSMQKQLYPKQTPSEASVLATRSNGVALCQARPLSLAPGSGGRVSMEARSLHAPL